jgi:hypothetical protein
MLSLCCARLKRADFVFCAGCPAGAACRDVRPTAHSLFFSAPKKSKQKKGEPDSSTRCAGTLRCSVEVGCAETRFAQTSAPLIHPALRYSPTHYGVKTRETKPHKYAPWRVLDSLVSSVFKDFAVEAGLSSTGPSGSGLALSERSEFSQTPLGPSSARHREAALTSARLFFGDFLLAKQKKVTAQSGAHPDKQRPPGKPSQITNHAPRPGQGQRQCQIA